MAEKRFLDFMDRFDGGGMMATGDKFEGGGLLSMLANLFATPRGSEDRAKQETMTGLLGQTSPPMRPTSAAPTGQPQFQDMSSLQMLGGQNAENNSGIELSLPRSVDGQIVRMAPTGLPNPPSRGIDSSYLDPLFSQQFGGQDPAGALNAPDASPSSDGQIVRMPPTGLPNPPARGINSNYMDPFFSKPFGGENPAGAFNDPNVSPPRDGQIVRMAPTDAPDLSRGADPNYMDPLSAGGFDRYLLERYDPKFVDRVRMNPEQYQSAYDLYVRNGGRL